MTKGINPETSKSHRFIDRAGQRNGRLLFLENIGIDNHKHTIWRAICDCGNIATTTTPSKTKSCGCIRREQMRNLGGKNVLPTEERKRRHNIRRAKVRSERKNSPVKNMAARLSRLHRHAIAQVSAIKTSATFEQLGYTPEEFKDHIEKQFSKGMGWSNMKDWQIDHIIPICTAITLEDVCRLNQLSNLRPMWAKENNVKSNKIVSLL
jgi:hypothetical protein